MTKIAKTMTEAQANQLRCPCGGHGTFTRAIIGNKGRGYLNWEWPGCSNPEHRGQALGNGRPVK